MTAIYAINCQPLMDEETLNRILPQLDNIRQDKVNRLRPLQKRAQSAAAGLLTKRLLGARTLRYDLNGRPTVDGATNIHISLSHTGNWAFCVIGKAPIGIDAEQQTACRRHVIDRLFSPQEKQTATTDVDFIRIWTGKEAYYKLHGKLSYEALNKTDFSKDICGYDALLCCYRRSIHFYDNIYITVCATDAADLPDEIITLSI